MNVQQVVRSMPWMTWTSGRSKCYKDTSYTKTKRKVRFKFDLIKLDLPDDTHCEDPVVIGQLNKALLDAGHHCTTVLVFADKMFSSVLVYQEFPIQVVELAST